MEYPFCFSTSITKNVLSSKSASDPAEQVFSMLNCKLLQAVLASCWNMWHSCLACKYIPGAREHGWRTLCSHIASNQDRKLWWPEDGFSFIAEKPSKNSFREKYMVSRSQWPNFYFPVSFPGLFRLPPLLLGQHETTAVILTLINKTGSRQKCNRCLFL